jgi:hypothetical protein
LRKRVGIVVPTLGLRPEFLSQCLSSIRRAGVEKGRAHITLVSPESFDCQALLHTGQIDQVVKDPGTGLADAINEGFHNLPIDVDLINWLGDDDLLADGSLDLATKVLEDRPNSVMIFGRCEYVDSEGKAIWINRSGRWAVPLLRFGPDLIPQPGALFRRASFIQVRGLNSRFRWAFDFDLFIKLSRLGQIIYVPQLLASFRWHPESLSVEFRKRSVLEAHQVRISQLADWVRPISFIWELPVMLATYLAGLRLTGLSRRLSKSED